MTKCDHLRLSVYHSQSPFTIAYSVVVAAPPTSSTGGSAVGPPSSRAVDRVPADPRPQLRRIRVAPRRGASDAGRSGGLSAVPRSINSNVSIDGADFNDPQQGNQRGGNETAFFFPQSAVREFQVVHSGAGAEVGPHGRRLHQRRHASPAPTCGRARASTTTATDSHVGGRLRPQAPRASPRTSSAARVGGALVRRTACSCSAPPNRTCCGCRSP